LTISVIRRLTRRVMAATALGARPARRPTALQRVIVEPLRRLVAPCRTPRGTHSKGRSTAGSRVTDLLTVQLRVQRGQILGAAPARTRLPHLLRDQGIERRRGIGGDAKVGRRPGWADSWIGHGCECTAGACIVVEDGTGPLAKSIRASGRPVKPARRADAATSRCDACTDRVRPLDAVSRSATIAIRTIRHDSRAGKPVLQGKYPHSNACDWT
jgi:hypothetical protein